MTDTMDVELVAPPDSADSADLASSRILIVDDQLENVRFLENVLAGAGFEVCLSTTDPFDVERICSVFMPDLILMDLHMPHMDGVAVMEQLARQASPNEHVPVMILTSDGSPRAKERAFAAGAADFLTKPFHPCEVVWRTRRLLTSQ